MFLGMPRRSTLHRTFPLFKNQHPQGYKHWYVPQCNLLFLLTSERIDIHLSPLCARNPEVVTTRQQYLVERAARSHFQVPVFLIMAHEVAPTKELNHSPSCWPFRPWITWTYLIAVGRKRNRQMVGLFRADHSWPSCDRINDAYSEQSTINYIKEMRTHSNVLKARLYTNIKYGSLLFFLAVTG